MKVIALHNYTSREEGDISFNKRDRLVIINDKDADWWLVHNIRTNQQGYIPRNYVVDYQSVETNE